MDLYTKIPLPIQARRKAIPNDRRTRQLTKQYWIPLENEGRLAN